LSHLAIAAGAPEILLRELDAAGINLLSNEYLLTQFFEFNSENL
jgi:hypothetical protein